MVMITQIAGCVKRAIAAQLTHQGGKGKLTYLEKA